MGLFYFILEVKKVGHEEGEVRSVGKKKKKEKRLSEQKEVRAQQGLTVPHCAQAWPVNTLGPLSALRRWSFISQGSAHQEPPTIQCHQFLKCQRRVYTIVSGFPLVSIRMCITQNKLRFNQCNSNLMCSLLSVVSSEIHFLKNKWVNHLSEYCMSLWCIVLAFGIHPTICLFWPKVFISWYIWW